LRFWAGFAGSGFAQKSDAAGPGGGSIHLSRRLREALPPSFQIDDKLFSTTGQDAGMKTIAFLSNNNGVGNTSLIYHLAWLFADRGIKVLAADLDPQADLSAMFLEDERLMELWGDGEKSTVADCLRPLIDRTGDDIAEPHVETVARNIGLVMGSLALSRFEDLLSESWLACLGGDAAAFRIITAFHRIVRQAAESMQAELVLIDVGPNLGAISRAALIAAERVILPLAPDLFSLQGLRDLGPALRRWRTGWKARLDGGCQRTRGSIRLVAR
jgi:cellulose biosynthesis protein BcsQ